MRNPAKPYRAVVELTDAEVDAFESALDRHQESRDDRVSRQSVLRALIARFCQSEGIRFPHPAKVGRKPRLRRVPSGPESLT